MHVNSISLKSVKISLKAVLSKVKGKNGKAIPVRGREGP
jgi:hypothetical protein